jgi:hypothetical protein
MPSAQILRSELSTYLILSDQLKAQYGEIDEETLRDTLEGISSLPEVIEAVTRSSLEDGALAEALKARMGEMQERLSRLRARQEKKRTLVLWAMEKAGLERLQAPEFSLFLRLSPPRLEVKDESAIPGEFFLPQPSRLDRAGLIQALKRGDPITGAHLVPSERGLSVRVR